MQVRTLRDKITQKQQFAESIDRNLFFAPASNFWNLAS